MAPDATKHPRDVEYHIQSASSSQGYIQERTNCTMRAVSLLLISCLILVAHPASGSPAFDHSQAIFESFKRPLEHTESSAAGFLSDAKKAILNGKHNMQKWFFKGKEYIKQNGLMCK